MANGYESSQNVVFLLVCRASHYLDSWSGPVYDTTYSQVGRLYPTDETVFDGHTFSCLSFLPASQGGQGSGEGGDAARSPRTIPRLGLPKRRSSRSCAGQRRPLP